MINSQCLQYCKVAQIKLLGGINFRNDSTIRLIGETAEEDYDYDADNNDNHTHEASVS